MFGRVSQKLSLWGWGLARDRKVTVRLSEVEYGLFREAAGGVSVAEWLRGRGLAAACSGTKWFGRGLTATGSSSWTCISFWPQEP